MPNTKNFFIKLLFAIIILTGIAGMTVGFISHNNKLKMEERVDIDTIYNNIFVNDINISGLTKDQAIEKLNNEIQTKNNSKKITLIGNNKNYEFFYSEFNYNYDITEAVDKAYNFAREGTLQERYDAIVNLENNPQNYTMTTSFNKNKAREIIENLKNEIYVEPINATIIRKEGQFHTTESKTGYELDVDATEPLVSSLIENNEEGTIELITRPVEPQYVAKDFEDATSLIGTAVSYYTGRTTNRGINMENAANKINDFVLYPGEIFSTNDALGEMTFENGYRTSQAIINGELVDDIGGGVCQISSTLYNALLKAELEIVERSNHSQKVGYMDWGFDATLYINVVDLKFKNNTDLPIFIESYITDNQAIVNIYGKEIHSPTRELVFKNALVSTNPPPAEQVTYSSSLSQGARSVKVSALTGYVYDVYKSVYEDGVLIEQVKVNRSTYRPRRAQVIVGTGQSPVVESVPETPIEPIVDIPVAN